MNAPPSPDPRTTFLFSESAPAGRHVAVLLLLCLALWGWCYGLWDLHGPDEGRYVQIGKELLTRSNWIALTVNGEPYDQKPPLPFWMFAAMLWLNGGEVSAWAVRLPPVLFATMLVLLTYAVGRRHFGPAGGFSAALMLVSAPLFFENAAPAELDMLLAGWVMLALYPWLMREPGRPLPAGQALLMYGALAGAFFTKGPPAFLFFLAALAGSAIGARSWRVFLQARLQWGLPVLLVLIGGWFYAQSQAFGEAFVQEQVEEQTIVRFLQGDHGAPFYYYFPRLFTAIFGPWMFVLVVALWNLWKRRIRAGGPGLAVPIPALLGWVCLAFVVFTLAHGKRQAYLLPMLPAMALLAGWQMREWLRRDRTLPTLKLVVTALLAALAVIIAGGLALAVFRPELRLFEELTLRGWMLAPGVLTVLLLLGTAVWLHRSRPALAAVFPAVAVLMLSVGIVDMGIIHAATSSDKSTRAFSRLLSAELRSEGLPPLIGALHRSAKPEYHVYGTYQVREFNDKLKSFGHPDLPPIVIGRKDDWIDVIDLEDVDSDEISTEALIGRAEQKILPFGYEIWQAVEASDDVIIIARRAERN